MGRGEVTTRTKTERKHWPGHAPRGTIGGVSGGGEQRRNPRPVALQADRAKKAKRWYGGSMVSYSYGDSLSASNGATLPLRPPRVAMPRRGVPEPCASLGRSRATRGPKGTNAGANGRPCRRHAQSESDESSRSTRAVGPSS